MRMTARGVRGGLAGAIVLLATAFAFAQGPDVSRDFLNPRRRLQGDTLRFCVAVEALTADFDRAVAGELAKVLLLEPEFYEVDPLKATAPLDYHLPLLPEEIYILLNEKCEAFTSFRLATGYPEWMALTRPYYRSSFVLAVTDPEFRSLNAIPRDRSIGTWFMTEADLTFTLYLQTLSESQRWRRAPYPNPQVLLERLLDGTVDAALVWEPALDAFSDGDPAALGIRTIPTDALDPPGADFGLALLSSDPFLRNSLDSAIVAIIEDGILQALLEEYGLAGEPGPLDGL